MTSIRDGTGTVLVISAKEDAGTFVKTSLHSNVSRVIRAGGITEAKKKISAEGVDLLIVFMPLPDGSGIEEIMELERRRSVPAVILTGPDLYAEAVYRTRGHRIYVLSYPAKKSMLAQTVNVLAAGQAQIRKLMKERDSLQEKLADQTVINRAKLLLIERDGLTEDEAHHLLERAAMDKGITKRKAAESILARRE